MPSFIYPSRSGSSPIIRVLSPRGQCFENSLMKRLCSFTACRFLSPFWMEKCVWLSIRVNLKASLVHKDVVYLMHSSWPLVDWPYSLYAFISHSIVLTFWPALLASCCVLFFSLLISLTSPGFCLYLDHLYTVLSFCSRKCHNIGWMTFLKLCWLALILHLQCVIFHLWPLHIHSQPNHLHHNTDPHSSGQLSVW